MQITDCLNNNRFLQKLLDYWLMLVSHISWVSVGRARLFSLLSRSVSLLAGMPALLLQNNRQLVDIPCPLEDFPGGASQFSSWNASASSSRVLPHSRQANSRAVRGGVAALLLMSLLFSSSALANKETVREILTPPDKDVSLEYLGSLFGNISANLMHAGIHGNSQILGSMFEIFNQIALVVGIILIIYSVVVGTLNTASSGKILGEKWNAMWLPVRSACGIALLIPTQSGYCVAQIMVMWIVYFGVGGAGTLWSAAIDYLSEGHSIYSAAGASSREVRQLNQVRTVGAAIFSSLVCLQQHNATDKNQPKQPYGVAVREINGSLRLHFGYLENDGGIGKECGSIRLPDSRQKQALLDFAHNNQYLAEKFYKSEPLSRYEQDIRLSLESLYHRVQAEQPVKPESSLSEYKETGWLLAGNYYRQLSRFSPENADNKVTFPSYGDSFNDTVEECETNHACRQLFQKAKSQYLLAAGHAIQQDLQKNSAIEVYDKLEDPKVTPWWYTLGVGWAFSHLTDPIRDAIGGNFESSGDPFESAVGLGYRMMEAAAWMVTGTLLIGNMLFGAIAYVCSAVNPTGIAGHNIQSIISTIILGIAGFLYAQGAMLAIYLPLIPFIIFLVGVLGWFVSVIEAMVAAPLVAIGLIWPDAQNEILGRAEPAVMLFLNLFLRPALMIIGLIAGILVCWVGFKLTNLGFLTMIATETISYEATFGWFVLGFIYALLLIAIAKKCFSLIHLVPDKVLSWIGDNSQAQGNADEIIGATQGGVEKGGGGASGIIGGVGNWLGYGGGDATDLVAGLWKKGQNQLGEKDKNRQIDITPIEK